MSNYVIILLMLSVGYNFVNSQNRYLFSRGYMEELKEVVLYNIYLFYFTNTWITSLAASAEFKAIKFVASAEVAATGKWSLSAVPSTLT